MLVTLAGAMSTAELGISLAEMIRRGKVHGIVCTGANLEEDVFNLVAHNYYERVPDYRQLTPRDEASLLRRHMNRVTDTCIPEMEAMRRIEKIVLEEWVAADRAGKSYFPHEFMYRILRGGKLWKWFQIDPRNSWLLAACERKLPDLRAGLEDATLGNMYAAHVVSGDVKNVHTVRTGIEYMTELAELVHADGAPAPDGRRLHRVLPDRRRHRRRLSRSAWSHAPPGPSSNGCPALGVLLPGERLDDQLRSYSGAVPNEKITWGKLGRRHAQIHHRVRRDDRGPARLRLGARGVSMANRLAGATSPYLLQHAGNPVDWYPWGEEAFEAARSGDRPIFLIDRVLDVPLVPRDGPRVVRGRGRSPPPSTRTSFRSSSTGRSGPTSTGSTWRTSRG